MSNENVKKFMELVRADEVLAGKVLELRNGLQMKESLGSEKEILAKEVLPLAKEYGCEFTVEEFLAYSNSVAESLRESDLLGVSGGVSSRAAALGLLFAIGLGFVPGGTTNFALAMQDEQGQYTRNSGEMVTFAGEGRTWDATVENLYQSIVAAHFDLDKLTNKDAWVQSFCRAFQRMELCTDGTLQIPAGGWLGTSCGTGSADYKHKGMLRTLVIFAAAGRARLEQWLGPAGGVWGRRHVTLGDSLQSWFKSAKSQTRPVVFAFADADADQGAAGSRGSRVVTYESGDRAGSAHEFVSNLMETLYGVDFRLDRLDVASRRRFAADVEYVCQEVAAFGWLPGGNGDVYGNEPGSRESDILHFLTAFRAWDYRVMGVAWRALSRIDRDKALELLAAGRLRRMEF